jgi:hypothetical protein
VNLTPLQRRANQRSQNLLRVTKRNLLLRASKIKEVRRLKKRNHRHLRRKRKQLQRKRLIKRRNKIF